MSDDDRRAARIIADHYREAARTQADLEVTAMHAVIGLRGIGWRPTEAQPPPPWKPPPGYQPAEPTDEWRQARADIDKWRTAT